MNGRYRIDFWVPKGKAKHGSGKRLVKRIVQSLKKSRIVPIVDLRKEPVEDMRSIFNSGYCPTWYSTYYWHIEW